MIVRQYLHSDPVGTSYLIGCGGRGVAAVVDPYERFERYEEDARAHRMEIRYVVDTHVHADHLSGGLDLASRTGARYVLHESVAAEFDYLPVGDGAELRLGNVALDVWHTPGHTPEHVSLLVIDRTRAEEPWAVLTGHTLMVGDMGRTELASSAEEGAHSLFESARRLRTLADYVEVLPGAYSGSVCGRGLSGHPTSTIGFERRHNAAFRLDDRDEFVRRMIDSPPPRPPRAQENRVANLRAR